MTAAAVALLVTFSVSAMGCNDIVDPAVSTGCFNSFKRPLKPSAWPKS